MFPCSRHIRRLKQYADIVKAIKHRIFAQFQTISPQSHIFQYINANRPPHHPKRHPCHSKPSTLAIPSVPAPLSSQAPAPAIPSNFSCHFERSEKSKIPAINTPAIARTLPPTSSAVHSNISLQTICPHSRASLSHSKRPLATPSIHPLSFQALILVISSAPDLATPSPPSHQSARPLSFRAIYPVISSEARNLKSPPSTRPT